MDMDSCIPRVLLVDDDPHLTRSIRLAMRREPWTMDVTDSAPEALDLLDKHSYDVIVSDDHMPRMRGSELLRIARTRHPETMRVLLTGQATVESTITAINDAGVFHVLTKPCPIDRLSKSIHQALEERSRLAQYNNWRRSIESRGEEDLELCFERAIRTLHLAYQPILRCNDLSVYGHEALLRTVSNDTTGPEELFEVAFRLGKIPVLDRAVRTEAARRIAELPEDRHLLVNVHPITLGDGLLFQRDDPLHPHASRVVFEITEQHDLTAIAAMAERIHLLREKGYEVAIDDLGAGYSGLNYFVLLRPDLVKFDRAMVNGVHRSVTRTRLLQSMTEVCRDLGIQTIAEGVEHHEDHETLCRIGVDMVQGYLYSPPIADFHGPWERMELGES